MPYLVRGPKRSSSEAASGSFHQRPSTPPHTQAQTQRQAQGHDQTSTTHLRPTPIYQQPPTQTQKSKQALSLTTTPRLLIPPASNQIASSPPDSSDYPARTHSTSLHCPFLSAASASRTSRISTSSSSPIPSQRLIAFVTTTTASPHCSPLPAPVCRHLSHGCRYDGDHHRPLPRPLRWGAPGTRRPRAWRPAIPLWLLHLPSTKSQV